MTNPGDPASVVQSQLFPPGPQPSDAIVMYDGHPAGLNGWSSWKAWDMRSWLNRLTWDLLRSQPLSQGKPNYANTVPIGLRDAVTRIAYQTDQNNQILRAIAAKTATDISAIVAE